MPKFDLGRLLDLAQLLDPRHLLFGYGIQALIATLLVLAVSVWRKSQVAILVTVAVLFAAAYFEVLRFIAIVPKKVDFRLAYVVQLALQLGWLLALCSVASVVVARTRRRAPRDAHTRGLGANITVKENLR